MKESTRLKELRAAIKRDHKDLEELLNKDERTEEDGARAAELVARIEENTPQFEEERRMCAALDGRERFAEPAEQREPNWQADEEHRAAAREHQVGPTLGRRFAEHRSVATYRADPRGKSEPFEVKTFFGAPHLATPEERAVIYGGALAADMVRPQLIPGVIRGNEPVGIRAIRDVLLGGRTTSDSVLFVKENVYTNAAVPVAEATSVSTGAKPESSLTFTQATAPVEVIAHWIPITRQALDDVPMLQSYVEGRLLDGLIREENDQLLNGDGTAPNISGILDQSGLQNLDQTYFTGAPVANAGFGPENYNRILRGKTLVMTTGDSMADHIIVNPSDWESLVTKSDAAYNYFGLGPWGSADDLRLWGLRVVLTEDKAAGSVVVGDGTAAQVWDRWDARILIFDQHSDFAVRNLFVLLAEERLGLAVYRPAAFALVDLA